MVVIPLAPNSEAHSSQGQIPIGVRKAGHQRAETPQNQAHSQYSNAIISIGSETERDAGKRVNDGKNRTGNNLKQK